MNIGIVTFWTTKDNYGQILQCWALQEFLRKNGHKPFLIRYKRKSPIKSKLNLSKLIKIIFHLTKYLKLRKMIQDQNKYFQTTNNELRKFEQFKEHHIDKTDIIYDENSITDNPPKADAYICGSDQIWGEDDIFYLNFLPEGTKKIAYAVSMATEIKSRDDDFKKKMNKWLNGFTFVGVREYTAIEACDIVGIENSKLVVDPTLLLDCSDYEQIRESFPVSQPYLLLYIIGNPIDMDMKEVYDYAEKRGLKVIYVAVQGQVDNYEKTLPTIGEWIDLIANAELVVTNSFHGTAFSLIFKRPFIAIPLSKFLENKNARIKSLLENTNTLDRLYSGHLEDITEREIDFEKAEKIIANLITFSRTILLNEIKSK